MRVWLLAILMSAFFACFAHAANDVSLNVERGMQSEAVQFVSIHDEVDDIVKSYFATSASSLVGAAATDGTAVTVGSKLTKLKFINGITMAQQLQNLFTNQAVTTGDYMATSVNLINGSDAAGQALSQDVEVIGTRLVALGNTMILAKKNCQALLNAYNSSELAAALTQTSLPTIVFGCSSSKQKFVDGMNLCNQITNFMNNSAVTQGDWMAVVTKWTSGI